MEPELKTLLTVLLDKVERIESQMPSLATKGDIVRLEGRMDRLEGRMDGLEGRMDGLEDGQRQMKEMLGNMRLKEIGRIDGRIDQLAMDVALGRKPAAE